MRVGADTAGRWDPAFMNVEPWFREEPNIPSARNAVHNALTRAPLHRRWWLNDPDCLLLRPQTHLTLAEVQTIATVIALTGGSLLLSDDLAALPPKRLRIASALLPLIGKAPQILDWFDSATPRRVRLDLEHTTGAWSLLALFNWENQPQDLIVDLEAFGIEAQGETLAREFWQGGLYRITEGRISFESVPAHGPVLLAVRPAQMDKPQYLGGDLHISQGLEVAAWDPIRSGLDLRLERPGPAQGSIDLYLPRAPARALLDGRTIAWERREEGFYRFPLAFERSGWLSLRD
jgi:alpha-galactosidase